MYLSAVVAEFGPLRGPRRRPSDAVDAISTQVEAEALGLVDYHNIVTEPMDLGTVDDRVQRGYYDRTPMEDEDVDEELLSPLELDELRAKRIRTGAAADIRLTFENAIKFNSADSA